MSRNIRWTRPYWGRGRYNIYPPPTPRKPSDSTLPPPTAPVKSPMLLIGDKPASTCSTEYLQEQATAIQASLNYNANEILKLQEDSKHLERVIIGINHELLSRHIAAQAGAPNQEAIMRDEKYGP